MSRKRNPVFHWDYLLGLYRAGGSRIVLADDLIAAGWLIEAGYATAEDDYEGPRIMISKSGTREVEARGK